MYAIFNIKEMRTFFTGILLAGLMMICGCERECQITKRAKRQLPVSLEYGLSKFVNGFSDPKIEDLKIVYENDSICLLQFTAALQRHVERHQKVGFQVHLPIRQVYEYG